MEAVFTRRSIRKYTQEGVSDADVTTLLKAAMSAPSAGNQQPWEFVVIKDKTTLTQLADVSPYAKMMPGAAAAILVCGVPDREKHAGFWVQDCSAAVQNILIEAESLKLGAVWLGMYPVDERMDNLRSALNIPEQIIPFAMIAVGHPAESKEPPNRYDAARIHYEQW